MNEKYISFLESVPNENNKRIHETGMKTIDSQKIDLDELNSVDDLVQVFVKGKINSLATLKLLQNTIKEYARFSNNKMLYNLAEQIDTQAIWEEIRHETKPSFLCHEHFMKIYDDLSYKENGEYFQTLFRTVYEGISDFNALANLRRSDIQGNVVTVREKDGEVWTIAVTDELAKQLIDLSDFKEWQRHNKYADFPITLSGKFEDSVFKTEVRSEFKYENCWRTYKTKLRKITKQYIGYTVGLKNLAISGMIYRMSEKFGISEFDFSQNLREDFKVDNKFRNIVENELVRSHYKSDAILFKNYVLNHDFITEILI